MDYLEIKAPAKINFGLNVVSKRDDGYHNIKTIFYPLNDLYDIIKFSKADEFVFTSNKKDLENNHNLIIKAKNIFEKELQKKINVKIELLKKIPIGAGLGGGSSDAAATLLSLNEMFGLKFEIETLKKFALQLGSDVPFFINPRPSFAEGRGEKITLIDIDILQPILIVNAAIHISTKEAYQNIIPKKQFFDLRNINQIDFSSFEELKQITNDFEEYVFRNYPDVRQIKEKLYSLGAKFALMTGSGPTVFGIFEGIETAKKAKKIFPSEYLTYISYSSNQ